MSSINRVILIGRLGKDPEIRYTNDSTPVANFSIATTESHKDKNGERKETTEWHNIVAWKGLAEICEKYLTKGKLVYIEGKLRTRSWEDKDGNKKYATEIVVDNLTILSGKDGESATTSTKPANASVAVDDDDLPF
jgi:single-strand DNA-binding protein